jgi:ATP-dependent DNA helicase RecG
MEQRLLHELLQELIATWENEVTEFKQASNNYSTSDIGKYFSALSNEANLRNKDKAWLIFGINDQTRQVVGTDYRVDSEHLQSLKMQIAQDTEPSITFRDIHELTVDSKRVIMFEVPCAPNGIPISWNGHYYARAGESLTSLGLDKLDEIRAQTSETDWSMQIVENATLDNLDAVAIQKARESYAKKYANRFSQEELDSWPLNIFLDRVRLTIDGKVTRAALILLGKFESAHLLSPNPLQITWKLEGEERAYEHFGPPFLLNTTALYRKIRNFQVRILPNNALLPVEVSKYDQKIVLEALHNCIAHQDYSRNGRIIVTEYQDSLTFENEGTFFEGIPDDYITGHKTPRRYRNSFLAQAMAEFNMIDTMGYGIYEMHLGQAKRYFPLPDYDLSENSVVRVTIYGKVVDPSYSRMLIEKTDLDLSDISALDRIQKKLPLKNDVIKRLRREGLIEGRKPNLHVSDKVAKVTGNKTDYIKNRAQDDDFYAKLIFDYLGKFGEASRKEIDELLIDKISKVLDVEQKIYKISNLLTKLRRNGKIINTGSRTAPVWKLAERNAG